MTAVVTNTGTKAVWRKIQIFSIVIKPQEFFIHRFAQCCKKIMINQFGLSLKICLDGKNPHTAPSRPQRAHKKKLFLLLCMKLNKSDAVETLPEGKHLQILEELEKNYQ